MRIMAGRGRFHEDRSGSIIGNVCHDEHVLLYEMISAYLGGGPIFGEH